MIELWFDGIVEPTNPGGHGGFGMLVKEDGTLIHQEAHYVGQWPALSNNCTEHAGAIAALRYCLKHNITKATIYGDADMIVRQLNGQWKAREGEYVPYYREGRALRLLLPNVQIKWIPREMNTEADELSRVSVARLPRIVTFALDETLDTSHIVLTPRKKPRGQRRKERRAAVNDEMLDLFMQKTAD